MLFEFIDVCAGIGGTRLAFERAGGSCVFSSEIDTFARETYEKNFNECPSGDIMAFDEKSIPDHNILVAGFPCQPFSLAGISKRRSLNRPHGFACKSKGQLFFKIVKIIETKKPQAFFLENVKHLVNHDNGKTFEVVKTLLENAGYDVFYKIINAKMLVPQNRERVYIVGFRKELKIFFSFPDIEDSSPKMKQVLQKDVPAKYTLSDKLWSYLKEYKIRQREKGNGFGYSLVNPEGISRTLSARYYKDGAEILVFQKGRNPRRLTPRECAELMGFPKNFEIPVSDTQAYKQFGNSVVVPIVERIVNEMISCLDKNCSDFFGCSK